MSYGTKSPVANTRLSSESSDETCIFSSSELDIFRIGSHDMMVMKILISAMANGKIVISVRQIVWLKVFLSLYFNMDVYF